MTVNMPDKPLSYMGFLGKYKALLAFGMALTFCSSFGQSFFFSLFNQSIRDEYELSHSGFGSLYLAATLASAGTIIWAGLKIDDVELRRYASIVVIGLAGSALLMATANHIILLFFAIYGLRLTGQGLMGHTATVTMARYLGSARGRGLSVSALGMPLGEAVWPPLVTLFLVSAQLPWRLAWACIAAGLLFLLLPTIWLLLRGHEARDSELANEQARSLGTDQSSAVKAAKLKPRQLLGDRKFICVMPYVLAPPFILTGYFFHQQAIALDRGWTLAQMASFFGLYAAGSLTMSMVIGPVVDRLTATRLVPITCLPLAIGLCLFALTTHQLGGAALFLLAGASTGISMPILNAMWAEVYGTGSLGSVRSLVSSMMVMSTALAPPLFGLMLDYQLGAGFITMACLGYLAFAYILMLSARSLLLASVSEASKPA